MLQKSRNQVQDGVLLAAAEVLPGEGDRRGVEAAFLHHEAVPLADGVPREVLVVGEEAFLEDEALSEAAVSAAGDAAEVESGLQLYDRSGRNTAFHGVWVIPEESFKKGRSQRRPHIRRVI